MISNHGVRGRKVGVGAIEKLVGTIVMTWRRKQFFFLIIEDEVIIEDEARSQKKDLLERVINEVDSKGCI